MHDWSAANQCGKAWKNLRPVLTLLFTQAVVSVTPHAMAPISLRADSHPGPFAIAHGDVKLPSQSERPEVARNIYDWYHRHASARTLVQTVAITLQLA